MSLSILNYIFNVINYITNKHPIVLTLVYILRSINIHII
jgi:hypothetical protein